MPIYCGYHFVQHRYCGLKIQNGTGASDRLWGLIRFRPGGTETRDRQLRRCSIIAYSRRKQP